MHINICAGKYRYEILLFWKWIFTSLYSVPMYLNTKINKEWYAGKRLFVLCFSAVRFELKYKHHLLLLGGDYAS